ncbi:MAG: hypothetical protein IT449_08480 [Phycisphaerales bacterium]|nr:hypothetical protein [Phycisphaerales bacterium]
MAETKAAAGVESAAQHRPPATPVESVRETLDSIVVAFILAFVFRAFVVEAFVIPTGSMAPTLYGEHGSITCEDCGYSFAYGLQQSTNGSGPVQRGSIATCPNCRYPNHNLRFNDQERMSEAGDRILVLKWPLDVGIDALMLHRWDVVVFKDPKDGSTNFIKRMIGMPGEVLCILDGDVYAAPLAEFSSSTREALDAFLQRKLEAQASSDRVPLRPLPEAAFEELDARLRIVRKTPVAQRSLWFNVYDDDFRPRGREKGLRQPRWQPMRASSPWNVRERSLKFDGMAAENDGVVLRDAHFEDDYAYNLGEEGTRAVDDQRVRFLLEPGSAEGSVRVALTKLGSTWTATIGLDGSVTIAAEKGGKPAFSPLEAKVTGIKAGNPIQVAFEIVDYRVALSLDGKEVLATTEDQLSPNVRAIRLNPPDRDRQLDQQPRVYGDHAIFEIRHLAVDRDVFYRTPEPDSHEYPGFDMGILRGIGVWASRNNPIMLRGNEYFCMGDNSPQSHDSRLWTQVGPHLVGREGGYQMGTVLEDQLIGRAFFVYWPSGHRISDRIPGLGRFGVIPNVGDMRWIR